MGLDKIIICFWESISCTKRFVSFASICFRSKMLIASILSSCRHLLFVPFSFGGEIPFGIVQFVNYWIFDFRSFYGSIQMPVANADYRVLSSALHFAYKHFRVFKDFTALSVRIRSIHKEWKRKRAQMERRYTKGIVQNIPYLHHGRW